MKKEINYLSERIENITKRIEMLTEFSKDETEIFLASSFQEAIQQLTEEKQLLESILKFILNAK